MIDNFYALIPAGGSGTRLWPISRKDNPKFFHDLTGKGRTLLLSVIDRLERVAHHDNVFILAGKANRDKILTHLENTYFTDPENVICEPSPKNSMAAIGLACAIIENRHKGEHALIGSFAADHIIENEDTFERAIEIATEYANKDYLVTLSITPTEPSTAFGYIKLGKQLETAENEFDIRAFDVDRFVEKPDIETAKKFFDSKQYTWNAGIFVAKAETVLRMLEREKPDLYNGLAEIAKHWDTPEREDVLMKIWPTLESIPIDKAIAEPASLKNEIVTVSVDFGWKDIGDFSSLYDYLHKLGKADDCGNVAVTNKDTKIITEDSKDCLVFLREGEYEKKAITLLGVNNLCVIETDDSLLICDSSKTQDIKKIIEQLDKEQQ